jgi:hypothetical protein
VNNIETLKLILKMAAFEQPVPDTVKIQMMNSMRKNLIIILKRFGKYGFFTMAAVHLFFILKKIGISISLFKSYILLIMVSVLVAGVVGVTAFTVIKKHFTAVSPVKETTLASIPQNGRFKQQPGKKFALPQNYKLEMLPFVASGKSTSDANKVTNTVYKYLKKHFKETVVLSEADHGVESPYMMVGTIINLENTNTIHARLVDARSSMVLLYLSEKWVNDDDLGLIAEKIAYAFSQKIE